MADEPPPALTADLMPIVDAWLKALPERDRGSLLWVGRDEVLALRAVLERQAELEEALRDLPIPLTITKWVDDFRVAYDVRSGFAVSLPTLADALIRAAEMARERGLAEPAAKKGSERG